VHETSSYIKSIVNSDLINFFRLSTIYLAVGKNQEEKLNNKSTFFQSQDGFHCFEIPLVNKQIKLIYCKLTTCIMISDL